MKLEIFAVYDIKARAYLPPFFLPRKEMAARIFGECINSKEHQFGRHPADYTLFHLGTFDDENAELSCPHAPHSMGAGVEYLEAKVVSEDLFATDAPHHLNTSAGGTN